jgi:hypothetical protein
LQQKAAAAASAAKSANAALTAVTQKTGSKQHYQSPRSYFSQDNLGGVDGHDHQMFKPE